MKLTKVRIKNYKCIHDSTEFDIDDITCLVGKNESGKTAVLEALHKFNSFDHSGNFDHQQDYPLEDLEKNENGVIEATFSLEQEDIEEIERFLACKCVNTSDPTITLLGGYSNARSVSKYGFEVDIDGIIKHISTTTGIKINPSMKDSTKIAKDLLPKLDSLPTNDYYEILEQIVESNLRDYIFDRILHARIPKFIHIFEYPLMNGVIGINGLFSRIQEGQTTPEDQPIVEILKSVGVNYEVLLNAPGDNERGIEIKKALKAVDKELNKILESWSQHEIYCMESEILSSNLSIYIRDRRNPDSYLTRKPFGSESHGFRWFFSFLMKQKYFYTDNTDVILLLDEPGLSLHAKAQKKLLQFFENELASRHQVIYTTHSPFMIDLGHLDRVRVVENKSLEEGSDTLKYNESGTKVSPDALSTGKDTLIPLQSALGYDISQGLIISKNFLIVEGKSDEIYIGAISCFLEKSNREGLGPWNIVHARGIGNVASFVKLFGATGLNLAVLVDRHSNEKQKIENLSNEGTIDKDRVLTYADFTESNEADVEDMLTLDFYLKLVNSTYGISIKKADLPKRSRVISRLRSYFETKPIPNGVRFSHIKPAEYLMKNIELIEVPQEVLDRFQKVFDKLNERENTAQEKVPGIVVRPSGGELETKVSSISVNTEKEEAAPANFVSATPPGGEIAANGSITVTFDNAPADVTVSVGTVTVAGKTATIAGPFTPGPLALTVTWADGIQALNYTVTAPDTDPPAVTGGTVKDGDKDVDPEAINSDAKIEIEFSEDVSGNVALQTEGGDDVGWLDKVEGNKAMLELVKGKEIGNETTYVIAGKVSDAAGNSTDVSVTFVTKGVAGGPIGKAYWDKFETYVKENGNQLQLFPEPDLPSIYGIRIDQKTLKSVDRHEDGAFWLIAYRSANKLQANLCVQSLEHYYDLKRWKDTIKGQFEDTLGELKWDDDNKRIGFLGDTVGHVNKANTDREFPWLHDRLVRLHAVFQPLVLDLED